MALSYGYNQAGGGHVPDDVDTEAANWFAVLDENQSGKINATELQQALMNSDWSHFNEESCRLMISMFDRDDCGDVDIDGFKALWGYVQQWRRIFEQFDSDRSGAIEFGEFTIALQQMGYTLSPEFIKLVLTKYDRESKSRLTFDNFIQACVQLKAVTDTFRDRDANMEGSIHVNYEELLTMAILHCDY